MKKLSIIVALAAVFAFSSCSKKDDKGGKADPAGGSADIKKKDPKGDKAKPASGAMFGSFDAAAVQAKLQGDWVMTMALKRKVAWHVEGDKITQHDGKEEKKLELVVESPCTIKAVHKGEGSSSSTTYRYNITGDALNLAGDVGVKKDGMIVACISNAIWTHKDGKCQKWSQMFDKWKAKDADCSIAKDGDKETFVVKTGPALGNREYKLAIEGDVLKGGSVWEPAAKQASWDEAKAALAAK